MRWTPRTRRDEDDAQQPIGRSANDASYDGRRGESEGGHDKWLIDGSRTNLPSKSGAYSVRVMEQ